MSAFRASMGGIAMLVVKELSKKIGHKQILNNINLNIPKGSIYGIIGENGAGKTTLIRHLVGVYQGDTGFVELDGMRVYENPEAKARMVYIPDEFFDVFGRNINDIKTLYQGIYPNFDEIRYLTLMKMFKYTGRENFSKFSKGMKKQVMFILALSITPDYLIMDEPFDGLDPHIRKVIWDILIKDVSEREMTIFISSHHLDELDSMCDHIALISKGKIVFGESLEKLKEGYHKLQVVLENGDEMYALEQELNVLSHQMMGRVHTLIIVGNIEKINKTVAKYHPIISEVLPLSLEDIFLYTLGGKYDEIKEVMG